MSIEDKKAEIKRQNRIISKMNVTLEERIVIQDFMELFVIYAYIDNNLCSKDGNRVLKRIRDSIFAHGFYDINEKELLEKCVKAKLLYEHKFFKDDPKSWSYKPYKF